MITYRQVHERRSRTLADLRPSQWLSRMIGVGRTKLYELIAAGEIETIKLGKSTRVTTASLHALIIGSAKRVEIRSRGIVTLPDLLTFFIQILRPELHKVPPLLEKVVRR